MNWIGSLDGKARAVTAATHNVAASVVVRIASTIKSEGLAAPGMKST